jgi:hypothetical protein
MKDAFLLIATGLLAIGASALFAADPANTAWVPWAEFAAALRILGVLFISAEGFSCVKRSSAAQNKFLSAVDAQLYERSPENLKP